MLKCTAVLITKCGCSKTIENTDASKWDICIPFCERAVTVHDCWYDRIAAGVTYRAFRFNGKTLGTKDNLFREYVEV